MENWRLFIAIELPPHILDHISAIQDWLRERVPPRTVRWVAPQGIHLTLKFLGDVPVRQQEALQEALAQAVRGHAPFQLAAGGMGCFPNPRRPRVAWVGVHENPEALQRLRDAVEAQIAPLGYPTEARPFHPHLTLGRVRRDARRSDVQALGTLIAESALQQRETWTVREVTLVRSQLKPSGAVYTPLFHAPLQAR